MTPRGIEHGGEMSPDVLISPETSLQGLGGMEFVVHTTSDWHAIRAFGESMLTFTTAITKLTTPVNVW
jgi:hypothetical protein